MKHYSQDFKEMIVNEIINKNRKQAELCREYGLRSQLVSRWLSEYHAGVSWARPEEEKETDKLLREKDKQIKRLEMENEILKKASAYFARLQK